MSSEVSICNLALAHLGDRATVASIDPPEGSVQAEHCATFYPIARDQLLQAHAWRFATGRVALADLSLSYPPPSPWSFSYAQPDNCLRILGLLAPDATYDDETQDYDTEVGTGDAPLIYTHIEDAVCRYTRRVTDTTRFDPLFVTALSYMLASYLAGPVIKGSEGVSMADAMLKKAYGFIGQAQQSDANQRRNTNWRDETRRLPSSIAARGNMTVRDDREIVS
jgi:hypothetical protein